jgi:L-threonylcarbamoyladenylate synthase
VNEIAIPNLDAAVAALKRAEVIVFPTETLYGLGAAALKDAAVEKVFQLKGRDPANPFPVLIADRIMLSTLVREVPPLAETLISAFWPGPLTLVLPARREIPRPLVNANGGVGVRISSQPIAGELVRRFGAPLTATSANPSGQPGALTIVQAKNYFAGQIEVFVDGGELKSKTGSTVAEVIGNKLKIHRAGEISRDQLVNAIGQGAILE